MGYLSKQLSLLNKQSNLFRGIKVPFGKNSYRKLI